MEDNFIHFKFWKQVSQTAIYISKSGGCVTWSERYGFRFPQPKICHNPHAHMPYLLCCIRKSSARTHCILTTYIHRMVALTYLPIPSIFHTQVDHVDGNRFNNNLWNLEWVTPDENIRRAKEARLKKEKEAEDKRDQEILAYYETHRYTGD